ncbi:MAG: hypothetical protein J6I58_04900 [Eubacterium sp.]|nr:hypothetical protein [Eubacterium sp.]
MKKKHIILSAVVIAAVLALLCVIICINRNTNSATVEKTKYEALPDDSNPDLPAEKELGRDVDADQDTNVAKTETKQNREKTSTDVSLNKEANKTNTTTNINKNKVSQKKTETVQVSSAKNGTVAAPMVEKQQTNDTVAKSAAPSGEQTVKPSDTANEPTVKTATCEHNWVWATKTVHHEATTETYVICDAWDEEITESHTFCNGCGLDFTANGYSNDQMGEHCINEGASYRSGTAVVGYIHHDAEYGTDTTPAWDEVVNDYQYCSKCGTRK